MDGKIIIIEGVEGVGKSTLISEMKKEYENQYENNDGEALEVVIYKFPDEHYVFGGELYNMLRDEKIYNAHAFQFGVMAQILSKVKEMKALRKEGKIVLIERCFLSVMAYGYAENVDENILIKMGDEIFRFLNPDTMILLRLRGDDMPYVVGKTDRYKNKADVLKIINTFFKNYASRYKCFTMYVGSEPKSMAMAAIFNVG